MALKRICQYPFCEMSSMTFKRIQDIWNNYQEANSPRENLSNQELTLISVAKIVIMFVLLKKINKYALKYMY